MLFNSFEYLIFFVTAWIGGWLLVGLPRARLWMLLMASYYFYTANNHWVIILLLISTQIDYIAARKIEDSPSPFRRKMFLALSAVMNLVLLGTFKYFNFFADTFAAAAASVGWKLSWVDLNIVLPVGISFYTFQTMSYTIDVYRGEIPAEREWYKFAFYVTYFPQLIAGPIVRASDFIYQIPQRPRLDAKSFEYSVALIVQGLLKKILLADFLAVYADRAFAAPQTLDCAGAWIGLYAFTFQIYYDFSGYSDIAIGCAKLMGYDIPDNFRRPYVAASFSQFWQRWHISLSGWLKDYLYIPLGGNRGTSRWAYGHVALPALSALGFLAGHAWLGYAGSAGYLLFLAWHRGVYNNLMLTMVLGGLWHGAAWHFVLWGFLHGIYLILERRLVTHRKDPASASNSVLGLTLRRLFIFQAVVLTWLMFRCSDLENLRHFMEALGDTGRGAVLTRGDLVATGIILGGLAMQYVNEYRDWGARILAMPVAVKGLLYSAAAVAVLVMNSQGAQTFIYFRF